MDRPPPPHDRVRAVAFISAVAAAGFVALTAAVVAGVPLPGDRRGSGPYVVWAIAAGSRNTAAVAAAVAFAVAVWRRSTPLAVMVVAASAGTLAVPAMKAAIGRAETPGGWLYPSGHATGAIVVAALLAAAAAAAWPHRRTLRRAAYTACAASGTVGVIGAVVSGTHYPSDAAGSALWCTATIGVGYVTGVWVDRHLTWARGPLRRWTPAAR